MATLTKEVRLIMAENGIDPDTGKPRNNYKYWNAKLYDDGNWTAEWGRVGCENPDSGTWNESKKTLDSVVKSKIKKGYSHQKTIGEAVVSSGSGTMVKNTDLHAIAKAQLVKSSSPVLDRLIKRFVDANVHKITSSTQITYNSTTGLFTTPLGIVTMEGLTDARDLLAKLAPKVRARKFGTDADAILCQYLRIIPQALGMKRFSAETIIPDDNAIQKQNDLIDSLESSYQAMTSAPTTTAAPTKKQETVFQVDLDVCNDPKERARLERFFENSKKRQHGYDNIRVREIFVVNIHDMTNGFETNTKPIEEVFHGTSQANCLSILKSGLRTSPPSTAAIAGKMFGNGVYGAKNSTKSLGYSMGRWGQGGVGDSGWLFICDFAMGRTYSTQSSCNQPSGYDSVWAKAGYNLANDELIVYRNKQVKIKYLLECK
jgi:poly [ADP-ribose] polymerase 2/3/4